MLKGKSIYTTTQNDSQSNYKTITLILKTLKAVLTEFTKQLFPGESEFFGPTYDLEFFLDQLLLSDN